MIKELLKNSIRIIKTSYRKYGNNHQCYICKSTLRSFSKYGEGFKTIPEFRKKLGMVGSDLDNFSCPHCGSHDRERHLYMFFDELNFWEKIPSLKILHFAPELHLHKKIEYLKPITYIKGDFNPQNKDELRIDATDIQFNENSFDLLLCNHVLEHIPEYKKAISEIYRVLKPGGNAILQTPYSKLLSINFEEKKLDSDALRIFFYGQKDHFRIFSEEHFFRDLELAGFTLNIKRNSDFFDDKISAYYGINKHEDLVFVEKPI